MSLDLSLLDGPYATVFDVGAHVGEFAKACHEAWPRCVVTCFEPLSDRPLSHGRRWRWRPVALGPEPGLADMHRCAFLPSSSMLEMTELHQEAFPRTAGSDLVSVPVETLDQHADLVEPPALLKLDVQGWEIEVLRGGQRTALARFKAILVETSHETLYHGGPQAEDVTRFMRAHGFRWRRRVDELHHPRTGLLLQSDELWVRPRRPLMLRRVFNKPLTSAATRPGS